MTVSGKYAVTAFFPPEPIITEALDYAGFLPPDNTGEADFIRNSLNDIISRRRIFSDCQEKTFGDGTRVNASDAIPPQDMREAMELTDGLYGFRAGSIPGFYADLRGFFFGGCMTTDESRREAFFIIRRAFAANGRWLFYNRRELLAHELCHSMRQPLNDPGLEEYFAYRTSPGRLRRYLGGCFITPLDAALFILPALLPAAIQTAAMFFPGIPVWPFWLPEAAAMFFLLGRNHLSGRLICLACDRLKQCGISEPAKVLFRMRATEIKMMMQSKDGVKKVLSGNILRFQIIRRRFARNIFENKL